MENFEENLVGPRSDERESETLPEEVANNGEPLWMAFLSDPEAINLSKEDVEDAKNALVEMKNRHPEIIKMCAHKTINDCREEISKAA